MCYSRLGDLEKAATMLEDLLETYRNAHGETYLPTLTCMAFLAKIYTRLGRPEEGFILASQALGVCQETFGSVHTWTSAARVAVVESYCALGRLTEARELLDLCREEFEDEATDVSSSHLLYSLDYLRGEYLYRREFVDA